MLTQILKRVQVFPTSREEVFAFFRAPENLARITPPWLGFTILTPRPIVLKEGALIDYTVRWFGLPVRWTTLITDYDPPLRFVDQQIRGPYSLWHHTHEFEETSRGTEMRDTVHYLLPAGALGALVHRLLVRRQLEEIFNFREQTIAEVFGQRPSESVRP